MTNRLSDLPLGDLRRMLAVNERCDPHGDGTRAIRRTLERLEREADAVRFAKPEAAAEATPAPKQRRARK